MTIVPISLLDERIAKRAVAVELSGKPSLIRKRVCELKASGKEELILVVPSRHFDKAIAAFQELGVKGIVRNLTGSERTVVPEIPPESEI